MTMDKTRKNAIRAAAARNGDSYVHTRRLLHDGATDLAEHLSGETAAQDVQLPPASAYITVEGGTSKNVPVAIDTDGKLRLFVFPDYTYGGQCTARTKRGARCNNIAWDGGQVAGYEQFSAGTRLVSAYGPLTGSVARRYMLQRCRVHDADSAEDFCPPEWESFNSVRHHELTFSPSLDGLPSTGGAAPAPELLAAAVFADYDPEQRQRLLDLLTAQDHPAPGTPPRPRASGR